LAWLDAGKEAKRGTGESMADQVAFLARPSALGSAAPAEGSTRRR
jgi:hypothetical protein